MKTHLHKGKLCSSILISNDDLYMAFYRGGYSPAEIARYFGKSYSTVWQQIERKRNPKYNGKCKIRRKRYRERKPPKFRTPEQRHEEYLRYKLNKYLKEQAKQQMEGTRG